MNDEPNPLNDYEKEQVRAIQEWKQQEPSVTSKVVNYVFAPVTWLVSHLIPQAAMRGALDLSSVAGKWLAEIGTLKADAGVSEFSELLNAELNKCDNLADSVHNWAIGLATTEGGVAGFFGLPGMVVDIPLIVSFALRTIHGVGLAYGFSLDTEADRQFALGILSASGANSVEEKIAALTMLRSIEVTLAKQTFKKMGEQAAKETFSKEAGILLIRNLAKQLGINLTKRKALQAIPFIGAGIGASVNGWYIKDVGWAARRAFQERWLIHNKKIIDV